MKSSINENYVKERRERSKKPIDESVTLRTMKDDIRSTREVENEWQESLLKNVKGK